ncbi:MAG TPA: mechanosensitive ion channel [Clostridia bacterium]|nr:mechanosensitive ion channel [Clostridia bacterium]
MNQILDRLYNTFSYESVTDKVLQILPNIILALLILFVFFIFWKIFKKTLVILFNKVNLDRTVRNLINNLTKSIIFILGIITALSQIGVNINAILASLGVAGLTLGFAAQDALSNIISGIFIFWDKPFVIGDLIEVNGHYGRVDEITMRSTRLITVDGKMLSIPNTEILNSTVASYTNFPNLRIDIEFTVASNENLRKIRDVLFQVVENNNDYLLPPSPKVVLDKMNDYNIELIFQVWIKNEKNHIDLRNNLREEVFNTLTQNDIEMPYETLSVIMNKE